MSAPFTLTDSDPLNPVPTAAEFTPKADQLLTLLSETMCPGLAERSLPISDRWLALMAAAKGIEISPRIFDSVRATGPIGSALDTRLARLQNEAVKTAFRGIVSSIRTRQTGVQGIEKQRWETAEKRVGMAVEQLLGQTDISSDQEAACCALIDRWAGPIRDTCSVGVDLQLISFQKEQATLFGEVNQSNLNIKIASWVVARVSELLREKCSLSFEFSQDVHHVNLAIRLILEQMGGCSNIFSDPYAAGMRERITAQKAAIAKGFLEVYPLLDALHGSSGLSLEALVSGGVIATGETYVMDPMSWRRLAEPCMKKLPFADFKSIGIDISERDGNLGCHRLSGGATMLGEELPRHPLTEFLIAAIRHEKLNADQRLELCDMANEKLTGEELAKVLSEAIGCGELNADQWRALCRMANEKLTGNELTYFLISASLYRTLNAEQWMGLCHMAHEKLRGENLACGAVAKQSKKRTRSDFFIKIR